MNIFVVRGENQIRGKTEGEEEKVNYRGVGLGGTRLRKETGYTLFKGKTKEKQEKEHRF